MTNGALKAGLIGAAIAIGLLLVGLIPCIGPVLSCLGLLVLAVAVGVLAVRMATEPIPTSGSAAGAGAVAGAITGAVSTVTGTILSAIQVVLGVGMANISQWYRLPPEALEQMHRYGMDPRTVLGPRALGASVLVGGCLSLVFAIVIFAAIAAVAALVYHSSLQGPQGTTDEGD